MSRRSKLALVILIGILLLGLGLYILFQPYLANRQTTQSPELPSAVQPSTPDGTSDQTGTRTQVPEVPPPTPEEQKISILEQKARSTVERVGSGSSSDGFLGYQDVLDSMTASGRAEMLAEQQAMQKAHPSTNALFGMTTHAVSSHIRSGKLGDATLVATVEALQTQDAGDPTKPTSTKGKTITVTFSKQLDGTYLIDSMTWADKAI